MNKIPESIYHISMQNGRRCGAISYLMKNGFKLPKPTDVRMDKKEERSSLGSNIAPDKIRNDIMLYMSTRLMGSFQSARKILQSKYLCISPIFIPYTIHVENE